MKLCPKTSTSIPPLLLPDESDNADIAAVGKSYTNLARLSEKMKSLLLISTTKLFGCPSLGGHKHVTAVGDENGAIGTCVLPNLHTSELECTKLFRCTVTSVLPVMGPLLGTNLVTTAPTSNSKLKLLQLESLPSTEISR
jgi:hypothetical protein